MIYTKMKDIDLNQTYCTCGTPDPVYDGHTEGCLMSIPIEILREVEDICGGSFWQKYAEEEE